ncbi:hypothetical protein ACFYO9_27105 [Streptomyces sp. NPDC005863]|uniref:hypothetical protein n=1 Tax=unclassified Streptomyces TaxID=2593676 RepID=UPI0033FF729D
MDDETPHTEADFGRVCQRDGEIGTFLHHLQEGAAMGHKAVASEHPNYGQQAVRTSMGRLSLAGHIRWVKEHITAEDNTKRWVTRTYWSGKPRSVEWWTEFVEARHGRDVTSAYQGGLAHLRGPDSDPETDPSAAEAAPQNPDRSGAAPEESPAYRALTSLRATDPRMSLSEADCRALEALAAEWLARGATVTEIVRAMTCGLPDTVHNPGGIARTRLERKMPPKPSAPPAVRARIDRAVMMCTMCEEYLPGARLDKGLCVDCYTELVPEAAGNALGALPATFLPAPRHAPQVDVTERVDALRRAAGLKSDKA